MLQGWQKNPKHKKIIDATDSSFMFDFTNILQNNKKARSPSGTYTGRSNRRTYKKKY